MRPNAVKLTESAHQRDGGSDVSLTVHLSEISHNRGCSGVDSDASFARRGGVSAISLRGIIYSGIYSIKIMTMQIYTEI